MFRLAADVPVYLHRDPIDFRAGINSLAVLVQETVDLDYRTRQNAGGSRPSSSAEKFALTQNRRA